MDERPVERSDGGAIWANRAASAETASQRPARGSDAFAESFMEPLRGMAKVFTDQFSTVVLFVAGAWATASGLAPSALSLNSTRWR